MENQEKQNKDQVAGEQGEKVEEMLSLDAILKKSTEEREQTEKKLQPLRQAVPRLVLPEVHLQRVLKAIGNSALTEGSPEGAKLVKEAVELGTPAVMPLFEIAAGMNPDVLNPFPAQACAALMENSPLHMRMVLSLPTQTLEDATRLFEIFPRSNAATALRFLDGYPWNEAYPPLPEIVEKAVNDAIDDPETRSRIGLVAQRALSVAGTSEQDVIRVLNADDFGSVEKELAALAAPASADQDLVRSNAAMIIRMNVSGGIRIATETAIRASHSLHGSPWVTPDRARLLARAIVGTSVGNENILRNMPGGRFPTGEYLLAIVRGAADAECVWEEASIAALRDPTLASHREEILQCMEGVSTFAFDAPLAQLLVEIAANSSIPTPQRELALRIFSADHRIDDAALHPLVVLLNGPDVTLAVLAAEALSHATLFPYPTRRMERDSMLIRDVSNGVAARLRMENLPLALRRSLTETTARLLVGDRGDVPADTDVAANAVLESSVRWGAEGTDPLITMASDWNIPQLVRLIENGTNPLVVSRAAQAAQRKLELARGLSQPELYVNLVEAIASRLQRSTGNPNSRTPRMPDTQETVYTLQSALAGMLRECDARLLQGPEAINPATTAVLTAIRPRLRALVPRVEEPRTTPVLTVTAENTEKAQRATLHKTLADAVPGFDAEDAQRRADLVCDIARDTSRPENVRRAAFQEVVDYAAAMPEAPETGEPVMPYWRETMENISAVLADMEGDGVRWDINRGVIRAARDNVRSWIA